MRNRFSKWSRQSSKMAYLLASCGLLYACQDPFTLDDEKPSWLNSSIYQSLQDGVEHTLDDGSKKTRLIVARECPIDKVSTQKIPEAKKLPDEPQSAGGVDGFMSIPDGMDEEMPFA